MAGTTVPLFIKVTYSMFSILIFFVSQQMGDIGRQHGIMGEHQGESGTRVNMLEYG